MSSESAGAIAAVSAVVISLISIVYSHRALRTTAYRNAADLVLEADRLFVDRPQLRPYFFDDVEAHESDPDYHLVMAAAEFHLDIFEAIWDHRAELKSRDITAWREWMHDVLESSPAMRTVFEQDRDWYPTVKDLLLWEPCTRDGQEHPWAHGYPGPSSSGWRFRAWRRLRNVDLLHGRAVRRQERLLRS